MILKSEKSEGSVLTIFIFVFFIPTHKVPIII